MSYPNYGPSYYGPPPQTHPNGTTILVLGILSLVMCTFIGPFAWSMGTKALREIDQSGYVYENRGMVSAGRVCDATLFGLSRRERSQPCSCWHSGSSPATRRR